MTTDGMTTNNGAPGLDLRALTTLIFDLDGVIWRGSEPIEGAAAAVAALRAAGKRCLYCTNNSKATPRQFAEKLRGMGIELEEDDVISSSGATAMYLSAQFTGPFRAYVIGEEGIVSALHKIGANVVPDNDVTEESMVDCVVVGIDRQFNYEKLRIAQRFIHKGADFIATNRDNTFPTEDGIVPGAGSIVSAVEAASGVTPVTIGKPRPAMVDLVMSKLGVKANEVAMIGDRLDTDIACARRAGIAALFVATGVTPMAQARRGKGELRADAFFDNLTTLSEALLSDEPYHDAPSTAQAVAVVQGTSSGLQNANETQPEAGAINLAPVAAAAAVAAVVPAALETTSPEITPTEEPAAVVTEVEEPVFETPVLDAPVAEVPVDDTPVAETPVVDAPVADDWLIEEPVAETPVVDAPVADDWLLDEPVADSPVVDSPVAESTVAEGVASDFDSFDAEFGTVTEAPTEAPVETIDWNVTPVADDAFALDDATTPGMAEPEAFEAPQATEEPAAAGDWDESWFAPAEEATDEDETFDEAPLEELPTAAAKPDAFDLLDFDLSTPDSPAAKTITLRDDATTVEAVPEAEAAEEEKADDGFNWKLD